MGGPFVFCNSEKRIEHLTPLNPCSDGILKINLAIYFPWVHSETFFPNFFFPGTYLSAVNVPSSLNVSEPEAAWHFIN